jgi:hypothetical protein
VALPLPALVALTGWVFLFVTNDLKTMLYPMITLVLGVFFFLAWVAVKPTVAIRTQRATGARIVPEYC